LSDRVVVFIDYQNVYMRARECFHERWDHHSLGQVSPIALAELLTADSPFDRRLQQVRIYRGIPDSTRDPKGYGAADRQIAGWRGDDRVFVHARPLRYPYGWPATHAPGEKPQEKGIDVALAIDFVAMAVQGEYDVGILMSTDTDLRPPLEFVATLTQAGGPRAEVAAWSHQGMHSRRLAIKQAKLWCHWLDESQYQRVADGTDYARPSP